MEDQDQGANHELNAVIRKMNTTNDIHELDRSYQRAKAIIRGLNMINTDRINETGRIN